MVESKYVWLICVIKRLSIDGDQPNMDAFCSLTSWRQAAKYEAKHKEMPSGP